MREGHLTRRAFFGGSLALAATACDSTGPATSKARMDPDVAAVRRAVVDEEMLLARYDAAIRRHPQLASQLDPLAAEHRAHLRALRAQVTPSPAPLASSPSPGTTPSVPADRERAVRALAGRETTAADARLDDLTTAAPFLAQLLASIGAAEATHAALLTDTQ